MLEEEEEVEEDDDEEAERSSFALMSGPLIQHSIIIVEVTEDAILQS